MKALKKFFDFIHFHPLFIVTLSFVLGIIAQESNLQLPFLLLIFLINLLFLYKNKNKFFLFTAVTLGSLSCGSYLYFRQLQIYNDFYTQFNHEKFSLIGTVGTLQTSCKKFNRFSIQLINPIFKNNEATYKVPQTITCGMNTLPHITIGDTISVSNVLVKKSNNSEYELYLIKERIIGHCFLTKNNIITLVSRPKYSCARFIFNLREKIFNSLKKKFSSQTFSFFASLFLGIKTNENEHKKIKVYFQWWGLSHYLARSGLHLIMFISLWNFLFKVISFPFLIRQIILLIICSLYYLLSWSSISFIRAFLSLVIYYVLLITGHQVNMLHVLTLVTLSILLCNPIQLFFLDFQLSFGLTFVLFLFQHIKTQSNNPTIK